jgi:hypothetical protein
MTTKNKAVVIAATVDANIALAKQAGNAALQSVTMRDAVNAACKALHKNKVVIGDARKCLYAQAFLLERFAGKKASKATLSQILSAFRKAVESGKDYNENASRAKAKAKAVTKTDAPKDSDAAETETAKPAKADATIILALPCKADAKQAAKEMRTFIEKMRKSENKKLVDLASYLTDAVSEFEGLI